MPKYPKRNILSPVYHIIMDGYIVWGVETPGIMINVLDQLVLALVII
jgi:hypothetical protein